MRQTITRSQSLSEQRQARRMEGGPTPSPSPSPNPNPNPNINPNPSPNLPSTAPRRSGSSGSRCYSPRRWPPSSTWPWTHPPRASDSRPLSRDARSGASSV